MMYAFLWLLNEILLAELNDVLRILEVPSLIFLFAVSMAGSTVVAILFDELETLSNAEGFVEGAFGFGDGRVFNVDLNVNLGFGRNESRVSCSFADNALTAYTTTKSALSLGHIKATPIGEVNPLTSAYVF
jgi:hypothetical protein